jgi:integrase
MASIGADPSGRRYIQFMAPDNRRRTIRLGKVDRKTAEAICRHVEALLATRLSGQPIPRETAVWLPSISIKLRDRLARVGLIEAPRQVTVGELLERYLARADIKPSTKTTRRLWGQQLAQLLGDRPLAQVTAQDAEAVRDALGRAGLAGATVGRRLRFARQLFRMAYLAGEIDRNPFDALAHNFREGNLPARDYARIEDVERLMEHCPQPWRLLLALARYAALRCPSEALLLRWADVDLNGRRLTVTSPKTERQGKPWRVVPIVPRLAEILQEAWELAHEGAEFVVELPQYRSASENWVYCNLRTQLARYMKRAGVPPWRRPFRVLRSSCVTDWAREHPIHAVAAWSGHTVAVAGKHYLTVTEADFPKAAQRAAKSAARALQNPGQQAPAGDGKMENLAP